jgi:outer membrane protein OmpA-like peptidoglycan-associated protein
MTQASDRVSIADESIPELSPELNPEELNPEAIAQLDNFVSLLADLKIIDLPTSEKPDDSTQSDFPQPDLESIPEKIAEKEISLAPSQYWQPEENYSTSEEQDSAEQAYQAAIAHYLPELLTGMKFADLYGLVEAADQKIATLEDFIHEPTALIQLLAPRQAQLFRQTVAQAPAEVVATLVPIIDRVIQDRIAQDRHSMSFALAPALPSAISHQVNISPEEIAMAIAPTMGRAIKEQIVLEQDQMVDALYPIIGSTISKYMAETIRLINQQVEETFSVKGIQRKIRAKLQGVSEAELILREASPFTVQAIFLIHKASGLVIAEVQQVGQHLEADMLAGMLTAIRSFANDCISQADSTSELNEIDYGGSKIILEVAGYCYLAVVVSGEPTKVFIQEIRRSLSTLITTYTKPLEQFEGDPETIPTAVHQALESLSATAQVSQSESQKQSPALLMVGLTLVGLIVIPWGFLQYRASVRQAIETQATQALMIAPELSVYNLTATLDRDKLKLSGRVPNLLLRQKAERLAHAAVPTWAIDNRILAIEIPPDPVLAAAEVKRVTAVLNQMDGVAISAQHAGDRVMVQGSVSRAPDASTITQAFEQIPGIKKVTSAVQVQPLKIETRFYFEPDSATLASADWDGKLRSVVAVLQQHPARQLIITGYSFNGAAVQQLALERAKAVQSALILQGINPNRLQIKAATVLPPDVEAAQPEWLNRCAVLDLVDPADSAP